MCSPFVENSVFHRVSIIGPPDSSFTEAVFFVQTPCRMVGFANFKPQADSRARLKNVQKFGEQSISNTAAASTIGHDDVLEFPLRNGSIGTNEAFEDAFGFGHQSQPILKKAVVLIGFPVGRAGGLSLDLEDCGHVVFRCGTNRQRHGVG